MNPVFKFILQMASTPRIDMQEDYVWVRRMQELFSSKPINKYAFLDEKIHSQIDGHEIPIRIFHPKGKPQGMRDKSIIYIHGGGWTIGTIDSYSGACRNLANEFGCVVYSIDYRLAPEHPYPAGFNDCLQAVEVLLTPVEGEGDREWILMGDSAGGNLAAAVSLKLRDDKKRLPDKQVLLYPVTYWDHTRKSPFETIQTKGYDYGLTVKKIQEYMENYVPDEEKRKSPYVSPLMAEDFSHQPPTLVITPEHDPLRDEGEAYGQALKEAGNEVRTHRIPESVHGFINYPTFAKPVEEAYKVIGEFLGL